MKKLFNILFVLGLITFFSCGEGKKEEGEAAATDSAAVVNNAEGGFDLSKSGLPFVIKAPYEPVVESPVAGTYELKSSDVFQMTIHDGVGDMNLIKNDIKTNEVFKFKRFIAEEPEALFYEADFQGTPRFHFFVIKKGKGTVYEIQDNKQKTFNEADAKAMFEAARDIVVK